MSTVCTAPTMTRILLCQSLLLSAGLALAADPPADLVSLPCSVVVGEERKSGLSLADWPALGLYRLLGVRGWAGLVLALPLLPQQLTTTGVTNKIIRSHLATSNILSPVLPGLLCCEVTGKDQCRCQCQCLTHKTAQTSI